MLNSHCNNNDQKKNHVVSWTRNHDTRIESHHRPTHYATEVNAKNR